MPSAAKKYFCNTCLGLMTLSPVFMALYAHGCQVFNPVGVTHLYLQELSYYRPLSHLVIAVHHGARYCPLTEAAVTQLARQGLAAAQWEPLVSPTAPEGATSAAAAAVVTNDSTTAAGELAADLQQGLDLISPGGAHGPLAASSSRVAAMAAAARLRSVLHRLCCDSSSRMQGGGRPMGRRQTPLWMYINHLGWCR